MPDRAVPLSLWNGFQADQARSATSGLLDGLKSSYDAVTAPAAALASTMWPSQAAPAPAPVAAPQATPDATAPSTGFSLPSMDDLLKPFGVSSAPPPAATAAAPAATAPTRPTGPGFDSFTTPTTTTFGLPSLDALLTPVAAAGRALVVSGTTAPAPAAPSGAATTTAAPMPSGGKIDNSSRASFARTAYPMALQAAGGDPELAKRMIASAISENGTVGAGGDIGVGYNFGGIKCFDATTEVLTARGWKAWPQALDSDLFATWSAERAAVEYQHARSLTRARYTGLMYRIRTGTVDLFVTPDHRMWVRPEMGAPFQIMTAREVSGRPVAYMTPGLPVSNRPDVGPADTITAAKGLLRNPLRQQFEDRQDVSLTQLGVSSPVASCVSSLRLRIGHIVGVRANKEMVRTYARRVIAAVADLLLGHERDAVGHLIRDSVSRDAVPLVTRRKTAIATMVTSSGPEPAGAEARVHNWPRLVNLAPEATLGVIPTGPRAEVAHALLDGWPEGEEPPAASLAGARDGTFAVHRDLLHLVRGVCPERLTHVSGHRADDTRLEGWFPFDGTVYCATVPNGLLIVRRNGKVVVSGNSDPQASGSGTYGTWESEGGQRVNQNATFAHYDSPEAGFAAIPRFIQTNFPKAWATYQQTHNAAQLYRDINVAGYATDPQWSAAIEGITSTQVAPAVQNAPTSYPTAGYTPTQPAPAAQPSTAQGAPAPFSGTQVYTTPNTGGDRRTTTGIVVHDTGGRGATPEQELQNTLDWFKNPASQVSANAVIAADGTVYTLGDPDAVAWHAGDNNSHTFGIELVQSEKDNAAHVPYTDAQYAALANLTSQLSQRYGFPIDRSAIVGHQDTAQGQAAGKVDPGSHFDWSRYFAQANADKTTALTQPPPTPGEPGGPPLATTYPTYQPPAAQAAPTWSPDTTTSTPTMAQMSYGARPGGVMARLPLTTPTAGADTFPTTPESPPTAPGATYNAPMASDSGGGFQDDYSQSGWVQPAMTPGPMVPDMSGTGNERVTTPPPAPQVIPNEDPTSYPPAPQSTSWLDPVRSYVEGAAPTVSRALDAARLPNPIAAYNALPPLDQPIPIPERQPSPPYQPEQVSPEEAAQRASVAGLQPGEHLTTPLPPQGFAPPSIQDQPPAADIQQMPAIVAESAREAIVSALDRAGQAYTAYGQGQTLETVKQGALAALETVGIPFTVGQSAVDALLPVAYTPYGTVGAGDIIVTAQIANDLVHAVRTGVELGPAAYRAIRSGQASDALAAGLRGPLGAAAGVIDTGIEAARASGARARAAASERILAADPRVQDLRASLDALRQGRQDLVTTGEDVPQSHWDFLGRREAGLQQQLQQAEADALAAQRAASAPALQTTPSYGTFGFSPDEQAMRDLTRPQAVPNTDAVRAHITNELDQLEGQLARRQAEVGQTDNWGFDSAARDVKLLNEQIARRRQILGQMAERTQLDFPGTEPRVIVPEEAGQGVQTGTDWSSGALRWAQTNGAHIRGVPISPDDPRVPDTLYHATTNLPAVQADGMLRAGGVGGLGGDAADNVVSLTTDRATAERIAADLRTAASVSKIPEPVVASTFEYNGRQIPTTDWSSPEAGRAYQQQVVRQLQAQARAEGWEYTPEYISDSARGKDILRDYFATRAHQTGIKDPVILSDSETLRRIDPSKIGVVAVPRDSLRTGSLLTDFDLSRPGGLNEIRSYGDVPLRPATTGEAAPAAPRVTPHYGVFGVAPPEAGDAAAAVGRPRFIPPEVRQQLTPNVELPDDPRFAEAVAASGGRITPDGAEVYVTRSQGPSAAGGVASRGGVFVEALPPNRPSSYARGYDNPTKTGGSVVLPHTKTLFRKPLLLESEPGTPYGFDEAAQKLGLDGDYQAARRAVDDAFWQHQTAVQKFGYQSPEAAQARVVLKAANDEADRLRASGAITSSAIERAVTQARRAGPPGSPERAAALKDVVSRFGGDPRIVDDLIAVRGMDGQESDFAIRENIIAAHGRRAGHDSIFTLDRGDDDAAMEALNGAVAAHPDYQAAEAAYQDAYARHQAAYEHARAMQEQHGIASPESAAANEALGQAADEAARTEQAMMDLHDELFNSLEAEPTSTIKEVFDLQQGRNPTPGNVERIRNAEQAAAAAQREYDEATAAVGRIPTTRMLPTEQGPEWFARQSDDYKAAQARWEQTGTARDAARADLQAARSEPAQPGYSIHPDIPLPPGVERDVPPYAATLGAAPPAGAAARARAEQARAEGRPQSTIDKWLALADAGVDSPEALAQRVSTFEHGPTTAEARAMLGARPQYLNGVADFLLSQRQKLLNGQMTARDVAKAYTLTMLSMQARAQKFEGLQEKLRHGFTMTSGERIPGKAGFADLDRMVNPHTNEPLGPIFGEVDPATGQRMVRPESVGSAWLWTPEGQRALNAMSEGRFDAEAWRHLIDARKALGTDNLTTNGVLRPLTQAERDAGVANMTNLPQWTREMNEGIASLRAEGRDDEIGAWLTAHARKLNGIGEAKTAFIKQLMGMGDALTIDAREINYWLGGRGLRRKGNPSEGEKLAAAVSAHWDDPRVARATRAAIEAKVNDLVTRHPDLLEGIDPQDAGEIIHHWIWDKSAGSTTTHAAEQTTQQLAGSLGATPAGFAQAGEALPAGARPIPLRTEGDRLAAMASDAGVAPPEAAQARPRLAPEDRFVPPERPPTLESRAADIARRLQGEALNAGGGALSANMVSGDLTPDQNDQRTPEERMRDAAIHAGVGALAAVGLRHGGPAIARFLAAAARGGPEGEGLLSSLGSVPGERPPRRNVVGQFVDQFESSGAKALAQKYDELTPGRIARAQDVSVPAATELLARTLPERERAAALPRIERLLQQTVDAGERLLGRSKVVSTGIGPEAAEALAAGEGITNKYAGATGMRDAVAATHQSVGLKRITPAQAEQFTREELSADHAILGQPNRNGRLFAHVTAGPPVISEAVPAVNLIWHDNTPRVTELEHHYGLRNPGRKIHETSPEGIRRVQAETPFAGGTPRGPAGRQVVEGWRRQGIPVGDGTMIADTPFAVGPAGESRMRMLSRILSMPTSEADSIGRRVAKGEINDPETLAAILLRESSAQQQPAIASAKRLLGIPGEKRAEKMLASGAMTPDQYEAWQAQSEAVGNRFRTAQAVNRGRTESLIIDPNPKNVKAIYLTGDGDAYLHQVIPNTGGMAKGTKTRLQLAQDIQRSLKANHNNDVPIIFKDLSVRHGPTGEPEIASGSKLITDAEEILPDGSRRPVSSEQALAPGRADIRDRYMAAGYPDIGSGVVPRRGSRLAPLANAAQGALVGAGSEQLQAQQEGREPDPRTELTRAGIGAGLGLLAGNRAARRALVRGAEELGGRGAEELGSGFVNSPNYKPPSARQIAIEEARGAVQGKDLNRELTPPGSAVPWRIRQATRYTDPLAAPRWAEDQLTEAAGTPRLAENAPERATTQLRVNPTGLINERIANELEPIVRDAAAAGLHDELPQYLRNVHERDILNEFHDRGHAEHIAAGEQAATEHLDQVDRLVKQRLNDAERRAKAHEGSVQDLTDLALKDAESRATDVTDKASVLVKERLNAAEQQASMLERQGRAAQAEAVRREARATAQQAQAQLDRAELVAKERLNAAEQQASMLERQGQRDQAASVRRTAREADDAAQAERERADLVTKERLNAAEKQAALLYQQGRPVAAESTRTQAAQNAGQVTTRAESRAAKIREQGEQRAAELEQQGQNDRADAVRARAQQNAGEILSKAQERADQIRAEAEAAAPPGVGDQYSERAQRVRDEAQQAAGELTARAEARARAIRDEAAANAPSEAQAIATNRAENARRTAQNNASQTMTRAQQVADQIRQTAVDTAPDAAEARMRARQGTNPNQTYEAIDTRLKAQEARLKKSGQWAALQQLAQQAWAVSRQSLDNAVAAERVAPEVRDALVARYPHYVPTRPISHLDPSGKSFGATGGGSTMVSASKANPIHALEDVGTAGETLNPLMALRSDIIRGEVQNQRNRAFLAFAKLYDDALSASPATMTGSTAKRPDLWAGEKVITGRVGGQPHEVRVPATVADGIDAMTGAGMDSGAVMSALKRVTRAVTSAITAARASFVPVNIIRDATDYGLRTAALEGGPQHLPSIMGTYLDEAGKFAADVVRGQANARSLIGGGVGAVAGAAAPADTTQDRARHAVEGGLAGTVLLGANRSLPLSSAAAARFERLGGAEGHVASSLGETQRWYRDVMRQGGQVAGTPGQMASFLKDWGRDIVGLRGVRGINERAEYIARTAAMRRAEMRGASPVEAMIAGRDASYDPERAGTIVRAINSVVPFTNATVQGGAQFARLVRDHPVQFASTAVATLGPVMLATEAWNRSDPARAAAYDDVPQYIKDSGIVMMMPWAGSDNRGNRPNYLYVPVELAAPFVVGMRQAMQNLDKVAPGLSPSAGRSDTGPTPLSTGVASATGLPEERAQQWLGMLNEAISIFNPVRGDTLSSSASTMVPPIAKQAIELGLNKDLFRGSQIASPAADERASAFSRGVAGAANRLGRTVGSESLQDLQPSQVEYLTRQLPAYGDLLTGASDLLAPGPYKATEEGRLANEPFLGGIGARFIRDTGGANLERAQGESLTPGVRDALAGAGMRPSAVDLSAPSSLSSSIGSVPLMRDEQVDLQNRINAYVDDELSRTQTTAKGMLDPQQAVKDAISKARQRASDEVLRGIPRSEQRDRIQQTRDAELVTRPQ